MNRSQVSVGLVLFLAAAVLAAFVGGIAYAGYISKWIENAPLPDKMPRIANWFLSTVNGTLALNLGAYLGIKGAGMELTGPIGGLQRWAAGVYAVAWLVAAVLWGLVAFTEEATRVASILPEISRTGLGIILAVFGAALGVGTTTSIRRRQG